MNPDFDPNSYDDDDDDEELTRPSTRFPRGSRVSRALSRQEIETVDDYLEAATKGTTEEYSTRHTREKSDGANISMKQPAARKK